VTTCAKNILQEFESQFRIHKAVSNSNSQGLNPSSSVKSIVPQIKIEEDYMDKHENDYQMIKSFDINIINSLKKNMKSSQNKKAIRMSMSIKHRRTVSHPMAKEQIVFTERKLKS